MKKKDFKGFLWFVIQGFSSHHFTTHAAASAFYFFICIIPILTIVLALVPYLPINEASLVRFIGTMVPNSIEGFVTGIINELYTNSGGILPLSVIIMLWTSSRVTVAIRNGLNDIHDEVEKQNFLIVRLMATLYTALTIVVVLAVILIAVFGRRVLTLIMNQKFMSFVPFQILGEILQFRQIIFLGGIFILFLGLYTFLPAKRKKAKTQIPGAIFTSLTWWAFIGVFKLLLNSFVTFSMYGSLATIIIVLMLFNFSFYFFFIGAQINCYFERQEDQQG